MTGPLELPETQLAERPEVDWERHRGDKRPKIVPPPGESWRNPATGRKVGHRYYTRVTTYADALSEQYQLTAWKLRRLALGMGQRADYVRLAASYTDHDRDRDDLDELVGKALEAAGPNAADLGTALHSLTERVDRDEDLGTPPPEVLPDVAAYTVIAAEAIRYRYREARTVCDELECAGTPDGHAHLAERCPAGCGPEVLHIIDTKTGQIRYPGKMSTQLAIYAHSDLYDPRTGQRTPVEVCRKWGAIVHLPVERGEAALFWIDLEHGWRGALLAGPVREWRTVKADDIMRPFETIRPVRVVDGEVIRPESRLASVNLKAEGHEPKAKPQPVADITEALKVPSERVATELPAIEAAPVETAQGIGHLVTDRCPYLELSNDPGARQCELPAGHEPFGPHEFATSPTPVERCARTELRLGECGCVDCRPDLAEVGDDGVQPDEQPAEFEPVMLHNVAAEEYDATLPAWPGVDDVDVEQLASGPEQESACRWAHGPATDLNSAGLCRICAEDDEPADGAAPGQDPGEVTDPTDPIADAIRGCVTTRDLEALSTTAWRTWTPHHKALATAVHDELAAVEAARKPVAAFEAALAAATTRDEVAEVVAAAGGQPWLTPELFDVAGSRWREVPA